MTYNTDSFFRIGSSHEICEDYALSNRRGIDFPHHIIDTPRIIVCDGCSSSKMTDVGARILALQADRMGPILLFSETEFCRHIIHNSRYHSKVFGLPTESLNASLLIAQISDDNCFVHVIGDGTVAIKYSNEIRLYQYRQKENAPFYLNYTADEKDYAEYTKRFTQEIIETKLIYGIDSKKVFLKNKTETPQELTKDGFWYKLAIPLDEDLKCVSIFSDGVEQFYIEEQHIPPIEIIHELLDFRNYLGEFVKRNCKYFFKKFKGIHQDDFSMATLARIT